MQYAVDTEKLKRWREERHWSQEHLAELAGIGHRTVQRVERGETASRETMKALAVAFGVDVMALTVDTETAAREIVQKKNARASAALRLSFWIHLASYVLGMIVFAGISIGIGYGFVMKWPMIWWTVGISAHAVTVVIVELVFRFREETA